MKTKEEVAQLMANSNNQGNSSVVVKEPAKAAFGESLSLQVIMDSGNLKALEEFVELAIKVTQAKHELLLAREQNQLLLEQKQAAEAETERIYQCNKNFHNNLYTATDLAKMLGTSPNKIGKIANEHHLKQDPIYGKLGKVSAVYKIVNTVTGDFYIGSSKNVKQRWANHKCSSLWKAKPNIPLYQDMQKYGVDKFRFQILAPVMPEYLKQVEQEFIEMLKPTYNNYNAYGNNVERYKETERRTYNNKYHQEHKDYRKKYNDEYFHQLCFYKGETLTLKALLRRFQRMKIPHATMEAKKYLINTIQ